MANHRAYKQMGSCGRQCFYFVTIPRKERMETAGRLANIISDQVLVLPMFFDPIPLIVSHRITGIRGRTPWNIAQCDVAAR